MGHGGQVVMRGSQNIVSPRPGRRLVPLRSLCVALSTLLFAASCGSAAQPAEQPAAKGAHSIDIAALEPSFSEEFDRLDISEWGCLSRWIAHTPWAGDFGSAQFMPPGAQTPFAVKDGILTIEARRRPGGRWHSGMLSAWNACNGGFAQKYGYFEVRMKLPEAAGFWPAFWLVGVDKSAGTAEIDVVEYHTGRADRYSLGMVRHPSKSGGVRRTDATFHAITDGSLASGFNTFGVEIGEKTTVFYLNRQPVWQTETMGEFRQPMYPLLSFAVDTGKMNADTPDRVTMQVDYIRAYQRKPIGIR